MFSFKKLTTVLTIATAAVLVASASFADSGAPAAKSQCEQCKPTTMTKTVTNDKGRVIGTKTVTAMNCSGCMDAVQSFLNRGKFEHTCSICGDTAKVACADH